MRRSVALSVVALALLGLACSSSVAPTNPYDPATPPEQQTKGQVRGTLLVAGAGPAVDVTVFLRENGQIVRQTTTASDGAFLIDAVVPGSYTLEVSPTGFVPLSMPLQVGPGERIDTGQVALTAAAAASVIEGTATLAGEADSGGTLVEAVGRAYTAVTNSQGQYHLDLPEGTYTLRASHKDFVTLTLPDVTVARGEIRILDAVSLPANPATVSGHVDAELAAGGAAPLADATVTLDGTALTGFTNAAGDFTLTGVSPGSYVLRVFKDGYSQASVPVLDLTGGEARALPDPFSLSLLRGGLRGTVALADSSDASGIVVEVAGTSRATVTGSDGVFAFDGLVAGPYTLSAHKDGYARRDLGSWTVVAGTITTVSPIPPAVLTPVGGAVAVAEGAWVDARSVHLVATSGGAFYKAVEHPQAFPSAWTAVPAGGLIPFQLSDADGQHVIDVVFSADGVTAGAPTSATVVLDRQRPTSPSVVVGDGSGYSRAPGGIVSLALSALDLPPVAGAAVSGVSKMQLSNDAAFAAAQTLDYALTTTWTLAAPATDGAKTVWVRFVDRAGNVSDPASATVILDRVPPASPALGLAGLGGAPAGYTGATAVNATLSASDANGPLLARLSNTPGFEGARYQAFSSPTAWTLLPGDGQKTVYAQFMDPAGNESLPVPATLTLDTAPPSNPVVTLTERDARPTNGFTPVLTVDLALSAGGQPTAAQVSEDPGFASGVTVVNLAGLPQPVSTPFTLGGSGLRTVYARFQDVAGNWSAAASARVTVDVVPPATPGLVIGATLADGTPSSGAADGTPTLAGSPVVLLGLSGTDDAVEMAVAQGAACAAPWTASWYPLASSTMLLLTPPDGVRALCARTRDAAGNESAIASAQVELDTTPPTNPAFRDLTTTITRATTLTGTLVSASTDPLHAPSTVTYQCFTTATGVWGPCTGAAPTFTFALVRDAPNVIGIRARDAAGNVSAGSLVSAVQDDTPPLPPSITDVETSSDSITLTWQPSADTDLDHFLVEYGSAAGSFTGTGAAQGPSPVYVSAQAGATSQTFTLTGLDVGRTYYVAVAAVDRAGNVSALSGQRIVEPNTVNPRAIASYGARIRSLTVAAGGGRVFAYVATNQGILQLDVTAEATVPPVVGRAIVPDIVPDAEPAVIPCTRGGATGHCVVLAGTTLEGDYTSQRLTLRASAPVVFFRLDGTAAGPAIGLLEGTLPALPLRVVAGTIGTTPAVFAVEGSRVTAFDLSQRAFPATLGAVSLPHAFTGLAEAALAGSTLTLYGPVADPAPTGGPPRVQQVTVAATPAVTLTALDQGVLRDLAGNVLTYAPVVSMNGYLYAAFEVPTPGVPASAQLDDGLVCAYTPGTATPSHPCATAVTQIPKGGAEASPGVARASRGNGHVDVFVVGGYGGYSVYRVDASGTTLSLPRGQTAMLTDSATPQAVALGVYATSPVTTPEHLLILADPGDGTSDAVIERYSVGAGAAATAVATYRDRRPGLFVQSDRLVFSLEGASIDAIDLGNPLAPTVRTTTAAGANYLRAQVQGTALYALDGSTPALHTYSFDAAGTLQRTATLSLNGAPLDVPAAPSKYDLALSGRWLFAALDRGSGVDSWLVAFDLQTPSAPTLAARMDFGASILALAATSRTAAGCSTMVLVLDGSGVLHSVGFDGTTFRPVAGGTVQLPEAGGSISLSGALATVSGNATDLVDASYPDWLWMPASRLPVGSSLVQGGYLVGLGRSGDPSGPVFDAYSRGGMIEGTSPFSRCAGSWGGAGIAHRDGTYVASCGDNGLTVWAVASGKRVRQLGRYDLSSSWSIYGAPLATNGYATFVAGNTPGVQGAGFDLWAAIGDQNATGSVSAPTIAATTPAATGTSDAVVPQWFLLDHGWVWVVEQTRDASTFVNRAALQAYEVGAAASWSPVPGSSVSFGDYTDAQVQPVSDGRSVFLVSRIPGGWCGVNAYDLRDPAALGFRLTASANLGCNYLTSTALARQRLYVGQQTGADASISVLDAANGLNVLTPIPVPSSVYEVTGIAASGPWLFYTYSAWSGGGTAPTYGLRVVRLGPAGDGSGATVLGQLDGASQPLANPIVSGETLFVSSNQAVASYDLTPLWQSGLMPVALSAPTLSDPLYGAPVRLLVDGPFAYLAGGTYRVFDLR